MIRVKDLEKSLDFYTRHLGMKVLRRKDYPSGELPSRSSVMDEADHTVIELTTTGDRKRTTPTEVALATWRSACRTSTVRASS